VYKLALLKNLKYYCLNHGPGNVSENLGEGANFKKFNVSEIGGDIFFKKFKTSLRKTDDLFWS